MKERSGRTTPSPIPNTRYRAAASWPSLPSLPHFAQRRPGWREGDGHIGAPPSHPIRAALPSQRSAVQCRSSKPFAQLLSPRRISSHRPSPTPSLPTFLPPIAVPSADQEFLVPSPGN